MKYLNGEPFDLNELPDSVVDELALLRREIRKARDDAAKWRLKLRAAERKLAEGGTSNA